MRLYIIRHGETTWNRSMRLQGQTDIELNENGRSLARVTARALRKIPFDLCFTSPLVRAKETAQLILEGRTIPIYEDARIQEIGFGTYEGRRVRDEAFQITDPIFENFFQHPERFQAPKGGESLEKLCARTGNFLDELARRSELQDKTILVSTHGAASRALLAHIMHSPISAFWDCGVPKNCAVTMVDLAGTTAADQANGTEAAPHWVIREQDVVYYENV